MLKRTRSKFDTKFGCKLCNLEKVRIDKSDNNIKLNKRAKDKTNAPTTKNTFVEKLKSTEFHIKVKLSHEHDQVKSFL